MKTILKKLLQMFVVLFLLGTACVLFIFSSHYYIQHSTAKQHFDQVNATPKHKTALLLGTVKTLANGRQNLYFKYRIDATTKLYRAGKIQYIIASGDNHRKGYDEPSDMQAALVARGIPESRIFLDYAGFRTLDSVVRSKEVFGQEDILVISQQFHNERALYIANQRGISAQAFNAKDVSTRYGLKVIAREYLARVKALLDMHILQTTPKFLGKPVVIPA
ncbi:MAG: SanA/YdcF family protein [Chitinophagales bacterium]